MNKLQKAVKEFEKRNAALTKKASDELLNRIGTATDPSRVGKIVDEVFRKHGIRKGVKDLFMNSIADAVVIGAGIGTTDKPAVNNIKRWYAEKAWSPKVKLFKPSINDLTRTGEMVELIRKNLKATSTWRELAQNLSDTDIQVADVANDVNRIIDKARNVYKLSGDTDAYMEYKQAVARVQRRINTLVDQDTSKLKRAYQDILDLTNKASAEQIDRAVKYASYFKQRYNSERIARTEMARAYGDASFSDAFYDEDCIGVQFVLSSAHTVTDICDFHTGADLYGMGAGIYPYNHAPEYPFHPHCTCGILKVFEREAPEATAKDFDPKAGQKFLEKMDDDERKMLLGAEGARQFERNPKGWQKELIHWKGHEKKTPTVPKKVLYPKE